jgi:hypothetical protein
LGRDRGARTQDRLNAIKQLLRLGHPGTTSYLESEEPAEIEGAKEWREMQRTQRKESIEDDKARREVERAQRANDLELMRGFHGIR